MHSVPSPSAAPLQDTLAGLASSGRQAFLRSLSQHARLISIETPRNPAR